jgi:hypothetical protein
VAAIDPEIGMPEKFTGTINVGTCSSQIKGGFRDGHGLPRQGWEAIFPIIQMKSDAEWIPIGTGFFISNNALFATAKHVLVDKEGAPLRALFGIQVLQDRNELCVREIIGIDLHPVADVGIGFLLDQEFAERGIQTVNRWLGLTTAMPEPGERIVTYSFPNSLVLRGDKEQGLSFTSAASEGVFEEFHSSGRDRSFLPGPCIRTSMPLAPGSSGGPVAFGDGYVFAINSTSYDGTDLSYLSPVSSLLELAVRNVRLLDGTVGSRITLTELAEMRLISLDNTRRPNTPKEI